MLRISHPVRAGCAGGWSSLALAREARVGAGEAGPAAGGGAGGDAGGEPAAGPMGAGAGRGAAHGPRQHKKPAAAARSAELGWRVLAQPQLRQPHTCRTCSALRTAAPGRAASPPPALRLPTACRRGLCSLSGAPLPAHRWSWTT